MLRRLTALALLTAALAAPTAAAQQDLRPPDIRYAAPTSSLPGAASRDLRSPDARDAALTGSLAGGGAQDLRSPDAADASRAAAVAAAQQRYESPSRVVEPVAPSAPSGGGTPWTAIAIPAAFALIVAAAFAVARFGRRRAARIAT
jgi:hypothetical protein